MSVFTCLWLRGVPVARRLSGINAATLPIQLSAILKSCTFFSLLFVGNKENILAGYQAGAQAMLTIAQMAAGAVLLDHGRNRVAR